MDMEEGQGYEPWKVSEPENDQVKNGESLGTREDSGQRQNLKIHLFSSVSYNTIAGLEEKPVPR